MYLWLQISPGQTRRFPTKVRESRWLRCPGQPVEEAVFSGDTGDFTGDTGDFSGDTGDFRGDTDD